MKVLQIGTVETGGGAASIAAALHRGYRARGHGAWQAVGQKSSNDRDVFVIPDDDRSALRAVGYVAVQRGLRSLAARYPGRGWGLLRRTLRRATHPRVWWEERKGIEDFEFPGSHHVLDLLSERPDVVHCHNLHGGYFDLRALVTLSERVPTALTLHDAWMLSGHCAHSLACDRWTTGCGSCPDLRLYPAVQRDATAENWRRKQAVFSRARLYAAAPSRWLADRVTRSMLAPALADLRVIPHGVDLSVFTPADRAAVRAVLGVPPEAFVVLLTAGSHYSVWKDRRTMNTVIASMAARMAGRTLVFVALEDAGSPTIDRTPQVRCVGHQATAADLARFYQAADVYLHATRADTFPTAVLEALACGTPVVGSDVGGLREQVVSTSADRVRAGDVGPATGVLVPPADPTAMTDALMALLDAPGSRLLMSRHAAQDTRRRFDEGRQIDDYLAWYREIGADWAARRQARAS